MAERSVFVWRIKVHYRCEMSRQILNIGFGVLVHSFMNSLKPHKPIRTYYVNSPMVIPKRASF